MKIGLSEIYNGYTAGLKLRKAELVIDKAKYENTKNHLLERLEDCRHYIRYFTNIEFNAIKDATRCIPERSMIRVAELQGVNSDSIRRTINMIVQLNRFLSKIEEELKEINEVLIDEETFREIVCDFNIKISDAIVFEGYVFKLGLGLGVLKIKRVLCDTRVKKRPNWGVSNKLKKEILLRGGTPFKVLERDESGTPIKDNGGEHWMVYWDQKFDYLWHWSKNRNIVFNSAYYRFDPTRYNNISKGGGLGNVNKLAQLKAADSPLLANFM